MDAAAELEADADADADADEEEEGWLRSFCGLTLDCCWLCCCVDEYDEERDEDLRLRGTFVLGAICETKSSSSDSIPQA